MIEAPTGRFTASLMLPDPLPALPVDTLPQEEQLVHVAALLERVVDVAELAVVCCFQRVNGPLSTLA